MIRAVQRNIRHASLALGMVMAVAWSFTTTTHAGTFTRKDISEVGWSVFFLGAEYDVASDQTTFNYGLVAASWEKDLSHWVLGIQGVYVAADPSSGTSMGLDPTTGLVGLKWDDGQPSGTVAVYSVTVQGLPQYGIVDYAVKGGTYYAIGQTFGPVGLPAPQAFSLSGNVFLDADGSQTLNAGEPALPNVEVQLYDDQGTLLNVTTTDDSGSYVFNDLGAGTYAVAVPTESSDAFNGSLAQYFTGENVLVVDVNGSDSVGNDFPFAIQPLNVLADFDCADSDGNGVVLAGEGRTIGFWKHQMTVALKHKGHPQIDAATVLDYLNDVQELYLVDPFQFDAGSEYSEALAVMDARTHDAVGLLEKQLLATELNHVAGMGLDDKNLQGVLINWAEYLAANGQDYSRCEVLTAQAICDLINSLGH